jgi:anti-sigma B factor antagonist
MRHNQLQMDVEEVGSVTVVHFRGRSLVDEQTIRAAGEALTALVGRDGKVSLLLDLGTVEHLSSAVLAVLLRVRGQAEQAGGRLALCGLRPALAQVFAITGTRRLFDIYPDEQQALTLP